MSKYLLPILLILSISSTYGAIPPPCGKAIMNLHERNPDFEGFSVQQFPSWDKEKKVYKDGHPYIVFFKFKIGMDHIVFYSVSGQVMGGEWENLPSSHWKKYELRPVEKLFHECRGNHELLNSE